MTNEWRVGNNKAWYDTARNCLVLDMVEDFEAKDVGEWTNVLKSALADKTDGRFVVIDVSQSRSLSMSAETRKALQDDSANLSDFMDKTAVVGASPAVRMMAKIIIRLQGNGKTKFFSDIDAALAWFKEG
jgi:hypothetical protein